MVLGRMEVVCVWGGGVGRWQAYRGVVGRMKGGQSNTQKDERKDEEKDG